MSHDLNAVFYSHVYHPVQAGSIDGTDTAPHDNGVYRAMLASSTGLYDPLGDAKAQGDPYCIIFVGRLSRDTTEQKLSEVMSKYGRIKNLRLIRHIVTGASQGYAFVEYETEKEMRYAYESAQHVNIDGSQVLVDYNRQLLMPGWIPRRLGGGLGGRKESGQLRFGGRDRPFRKPLRPIPEKELEKLGIPLPGNYLQRWEIPPLPKRRSHRSGDKSVVLEYEKRSSELSSKESQFQDESGRKQHKLRADDTSKGYYEEDYKNRHHNVRRASYQERESDDWSTYQEADHHKRYGGRSHSQEKHAGHEKKSYVSSEDHKRHQTEKHGKKQFYGELQKHEKEDDASRRYHAEKHEEKDSFEEPERRGKRESSGDHNREDDDVGRHHHRKHERKNIWKEERGTSHDHRRHSEEDRHYHHHHDSRKDDDRHHKRKDEYSKERKSRRSPSRDRTSHDDNTRRQKRRRGDRNSPDNNKSSETDSMRMERHKERLNSRDMNRWDPSEG